MPLHVLIAILGMLSGFSMLLGLVFLRLTLTRRLKKELKPRGEYWESGTLDFGFMNTALFAWACVLPYVQRSVKFRIIYPYLDVKGQARWFEKVFAYGVVGGLFAIFLFGAIFVLIEP